MDQKSENHKGDQWIIAFVTANRTQNAPQIEMDLLRININHNCPNNMLLVCTYLLLMKYLLVLYTIRLYTLSSVNGVIWKKNMNLDKV